MDVFNEMNEFSQSKNPERRLFDRIMAKAETAYQINISKNMFIFMRDDSRQRQDKAAQHSATDLIEMYAKKYIFVEDQETFKSIFSQANILNAFYAGKRALDCEYRVLEDNKFVWVCNTLQLFQDKKDDDIVGYAYIENIDDEKNKELELIYRSEHDLLTGLYNKVTAEEYIQRFLESDEGKSGLHAFLIVDIDFFKSFNDNFGHAFGDAILSRKAAEIRELFRPTDICGRVGGDELIVFMKNISNRNAVVNKANELSRKVIEEYTQNGNNYKITVSIGVSFYREHGANFDSLYRHADAALYYSKGHGRNKTTVYDADMTEAQSMVNNIDPHFVQSLNFNKNIIPFVFKILYESPNRQSTIDSVLALVGKHFNVSRAYVFETNEDNTYIKNTFEWCNDRIEPQIHNLQKLLYTNIGDYSKNFSQEGLYYMPDVSQAVDGVRQVLEPQKIKSMVQFSIIQKDVFKGLIGFDQCDFVRKPSSQEMYEIKTIANIMGVFILGMRAIEESEASRKLALSIVNSLNSYAYVIDPATYVLQFINDRTKELTLDAKVGQKCYAAFWKRDEPCEQCPFCGLKSMPTNQKCCMTIHNPNYNVWVRVTASWINWHHNQISCLLDSVDITEYLNKK